MLMRRPTSRLIIWMDENWNKSHMLFTGNARIIVMLRCIICNLIGDVVDVSKHNGAGRVTGVIAVPRV
jgi:hypothetical protein